MNWDDILTNAMGTIVGTGALTIVAWIGKKPIKKWLVNLFFEIEEKSYNLEEMKNKDRGRLTAGEWEMINEQRRKFDEMWKRKEARKKANEQKTNKMP